MSETTQKQVEETGTSTSENTITDSPPDLGDQIAADQEEDKNNDTEGNKELEIKGYKYQSPPFV